MWCIRCVQSLACKCAAGAGEMCITGVYERQREERGSQMYVCLGASVCVCVCLNTKHTHVSFKTFVVPRLSHTGYHILQESVETQTWCHIMKTVYTAYESLSLLI